MLYKRSFYSCLTVLGFWLISFPSKGQLAIQKVYGGPCVGTEITFNATGVSSVDSWWIYGANYTVTSGGGTSYAITVKWDSPFTNVGVGASAAGESDTYLLDIFPPISPGVSITSSTTNSCEGTEVSFVASAEDAGTSPTYQWFIDNISVQNGSSNSYVSSELEPGTHEVYVRLYGVDYNCYTEFEVFSNSIQLDIEEPAPFEVSLYDPGPICPADLEFFGCTATPLDPATHTYQWYVNSYPAEPSDDPGIPYHAFVSETPLNEGDIIKCKVTSDECKTPNPAWSNEITLAVKEPAFIGPQLGINISDITVCEGEDFTFEAVSSNGTISNIRWEMDGVFVGDDVFFTTDQFTDQTLVELSADVTYSEECVPLTTTTVSKSTEYIPFEFASKADVNVSPSGTYNIYKGSFQLIETWPKNNKYFYQWRYNGSIIPGATSHSYLADQEGVYAVDIAYFSCNLSPDPVEIIEVIPHDDVLNWIEVLNYDEYGRPFAAGRSYFDLAGKPLQQQTKLFSGNTMNTDTVVLASATIRDRYDRPVINTMNAPLGSVDFEYAYNFVQNLNEEPYDYQNFDEKETPDPILNTNPGTLGWYYSENNTIEENVPITDYPYSRVEYYDDGTGEIKKSAGPGEVFKLGSGHETWSNTFGASTELNDYLTVRNTYVFPGLNDPDNLEREAIVSVGRDPNGKFSLSISDRSGNVLMTARSGDLIKEITKSSFLGEPFIYFYILQDNTPIATSGTSGFSVENILTGADLNQPTTLDAGFYRAIITDPDQSLNIVYNNGYGSVSYNFYDNVGRLITSVSPNGLEQLNNEMNYNQIDKTTYTYNHQGWLLSTTEPDAGTTEYIYRKDGSIRYSQNAKQRENIDWSYTDYDKLGRPVESGEVHVVPDVEGNTVPFTDLDPDNNLKTNDLLSSINNSGGFTASKRDWVKTYYDLPDENFYNQTGQPLSQDFVMGAVSYTENEHIKTWYSYDEQGRVTWMAQQPKAFIDPVRTFLVNYEYDFLGNVLQVAYSSYQTTGTTTDMVDQFHHYYIYDADKRLSKAYTSLNGSLIGPDIEGKGELQARYEYYLHGPLKRIELNGNMQGIDFVYNINGWLKQINHPSLTAQDDPGGDNDDAFGMILNYYEENLQGLFDVSSIMPKHNGLNIHGLPDDIKGHLSVDLAFMFPIMKPGNLEGNMLKKYSANNQMYKKMIERWKDQHTNN